MEAAHEGGVPHLDAVEPLDVGNPVPAGSNQAQGKAIGLGQGGAVHLVRQDVVAAHGISKRHAAGEVLPDLDSPHLLLARIGAKEDHLFGAAAHLGLLQERRQGRARPLGIADSGGEPGEAVIAGAFEGEGDLAPGAGLEVVERQPERVPNGPADLQRPGLLVDHGAVVMRDAEEPLIGRQPGVQVLPSLEVLDITGCGVRNRRRLVGPGNDLLARAGRKRPGQGGAENRQSGERRTAVGEEVAAGKMIGLHCLPPSIQ